MEENKKTVGQQAYDIAASDTYAVTAIDQMRESLTDYEKEILECINRGIEQFKDNFFVVVVMRLDDSMVTANVIRARFFPRKSCPTPDYNQDVYKYESGDLQYLWSIPDRTTCHTYIKNYKQVVPEEQHLLAMIIKFFNGDLDKLCMKLNGETSKSGYVENLYVTPN